MHSIFAVPRLVAALALMLLAGVALPSPATASSQPQTESERVLAIAQQQLGDRYTFAATGPNTFDCSGFTYYVFREAGVLDLIGGRRRTVAGLHRWFRNNGLVTKDIASARPGDLLVWGQDKHVGIYVGDGWAISALVNPYGVKLHRFDKINLRLTAVLNVNLER